VQNKNGETPLHIASRYGCTEIVKFLCEYGANLDVQDDVSLTIFFCIALLFKMLKLAEIY
jgi:ankyrin repeat protein